MSHPSAELAAVCVSCLSVLQDPGAELLDGRMRGGETVQAESH